MAENDECTLRIIGRYQSQNIVNTVHYRVLNQTAPETTILQKLCDAWETGNKATWLAAHIDSYELIGLKAFGKTGVSKTPGVLEIGENGAVVGDGSAAALNRTITLYTGDIKHRRRGRVMLSGSPQAHFDETTGAVTPAGIIILDNLGAVLITLIADGNDDFEPGIPATVTDIWQDFTDYKGRITPSLVKSRRIREFLIG